MAARLVLATPAASLPDEIDSETPLDEAGGTSTEPTDALSELRADLTSFSDFASSS